MEHNPFATPDFLLIFLLNLKLFQQSENVLDQEKKGQRWIHLTLNKNVGIFNVNKISLIFLCKEKFQIFILWGD